MFAGIVLAAGASTRFGSPKALLRVGDEPAVARACRILREGGCDSVLVVLGAQAETIRSAIPPTARPVVNTTWSAGRTGSVKAGLRALRGLEGAVIYPIDHPAVDGATIRALLGPRADIVVPTFEGHRGHPTLFRTATFPEILHLGDDQPLHDVVHAQPARVREVVVPDAAILLNIDTPGDVAKLEAHFRRWKPARPAT